MRSRRKLRPVSRSIRNLSTETTIEDVIARRVGRPNEMMTCVLGAHGSAATGFRRGIKALAAPGPAWGAPHDQIRKAAGCRVDAHTPGDCAHDWRPARVSAGPRFLDAAAGDCASGHRFTLATRSLRSTFGFHQSQIG